MPHRTLYRVTGFNEAVSESGLERAPTAETWLRSALSLIGTERENSEEEARCYQEALRLRTDYPEAHNNMAILRKAQGDEAAAAQHYREALRHVQNIPRLITTTPGCSNPEEATKAPRTITVKLSTFGLNTWTRTIATPTCSGPADN